MAQKCIKSDKKQTHHDIYIKNNLINIYIKQYEEINKINRTRPS